MERELPGAPFAPYLSRIANGPDAPRHALRTASLRVQRKLKKNDRFRREIVDLPFACEVGLDEGEAVRA